MTALLWLAPLLPLVFAFGLMRRRLGERLSWLAPWAPLPALALAVIGPEERLELAWLGLGLRLELDAVGRAFLLFTALLWWLSGLYARVYLADDPHRRRFFGFFLVAMAGNLGLILTHDLFGFLSFYAVMSFAAYGLVLHRGDGEARRAGLVYLVLVVVGEVLLFSGLLLSQAGDGRQEAAVVLLLLGFGIKAGALPLHVWLPLAHPVAPTPASAVLSGAMIKVGLLGWLRFLPLGALSLPEWGAVVMVAGMAAALGGVVVGLTQRDPKVLLAYSSISQMGLMTTAVGLGLAIPSAWPSALPVVTLYAFHHALAKGALFLGVGMVDRAEVARERRWAMVGVAGAALAMAGLPLTGGAVAKAGLKSVLGLSPEAPAALLVQLLPLATVGTTALMLRLLMLLHGRGRGGPTGHAPWGAWLPLLAAVAAFGEVGRRWTEMAFADLLGWSSWWPPMVGAALALPLLSRQFPDRLRVVPGDLLGLYVALARRLGAAGRASARFVEWTARFGGAADWARGWLSRLGEETVRWEGWLAVWGNGAGLLPLLLAVMMVALF